MLDNAVHEAGHAAIAFEYGWRVTWITVEGEIRYKFYHTDPVQKRVIGSLAGRIAELIWFRNSRRYRRSDKDLRKTLTDFHSGGYPIEEDRPGKIDDLHVLGHLLQLHPAATDKELMELYRQWEGTTRAFLSQPSVWARVKALALELVEHKTLTGHRAMKVLCRAVKPDLTDQEIKLLRKLEEGGVQRGGTRINVRYTPLIKACYVSAESRAVAWLNGVVTNTAWFYEITAKGKYTLHALDSR